MVVSIILIAIEARSCNFGRGYASFLPPQLHPRFIDVTKAFAAEVIIKARQPHLASAIEDTLVT